MADNISGVLIAHRPKQKSARCVGWDGDEVLKRLWEREEGEEEGRQKPIRKIQGKSRKVAKRGGSGREDNNRLTSGTMVKVALRRTFVIEKSKWTHNPMDQGGHEG